MVNGIIPFTTSAAKGADSMDIPALSMAMSQMNVMNQFSTAMLSKAIDTYGESGDDMVKMMEQSVNPELGANIDVSV